VVVYKTRQDELALKVDYASLAARKFSRVFV
jgi:hypothetical protein